MTREARIRVNSAYAPMPMYATRIPGVRPLTSGATASMTPAPSIPGISGKTGFTRYCPWMKKTSP